MKNELTMKGRSRAEAAFARFTRVSSLPRLLRSSDAANLLVLATYLAGMLLHTSLFYLYSEDYELVIATEHVQRGLLVGKSTGWPYGPLSPYLAGGYAWLFGNNILALRIFTAALELSAVFPIYWTLRRLCDPFLASAISLFSFSVFTFPFPRLEYYMEGSLAAFAIFFAVRFLDRERIGNLYGSALFAVAAFAAKGHPNGSLLLVLIPAGLFAVRCVVGRNTFLRRGTEALSPGQRLTQERPWAFFGLALLCVFSLVGFLRKTVYKASFPTSEFRSVGGLLLLGLIGVIYVLVHRTRRRAAEPDEGLTQGAIGEEPRIKASRILAPFVVCASLMPLVLFLAGYSWDDLLFFLFPLDVLLDHVGQVRSGRSWASPLFISFLLMLLYMFRRGLVTSKDGRVSLFLVLLLPATFTRFFPNYNMLYLAGFVVAIFVAIVVPCVVERLLTMAVAQRLKTTLGIFLVIYAVGSQLLLAVIPQWQDLLAGKLTFVRRWPAGGIFIEKDLEHYFMEVDAVLRQLKAEQKNLAFLSSRYLKYVPLIYGYNDALSGQNVLLGLARMRSYEEVAKTSGVESGRRLDRENMVYAWRQGAIKKMEEAQVDYVVISFYDFKTLAEGLGPPTDSMKLYLSLGFEFVAAIKPYMKLHERSNLPEGAVVLRRKR